MDTSNPKGPGADATRADFPASHPYSRTSRHPSHVVLGDQSLLIQCCEILLERGHRLLAVVSTQPRIVAWCGQHEVACLASYDDLRPLEFDYLHSITNLTMLPAWLLDLPKRAAINFHDGPLPRYAGLNAPIWAMIHGESRHGITFHRMQARADVGEVHVQRFFPIQDDDTGFSLNARCYEAGLDAFEELVGMIENDRLTGTPQDLKSRTYHRLGERPDGLGQLDWSKSAESLARLVRALDFGPYANPVALPKVVFEEHLFLVRAAKPVSMFVGSAEGNTAAGSVRAIDERGIDVACAEGSLQITRICDARGRPLDVVEYCARIDLRVGHRLTVASQAQTAGLAAWAIANVRHEDSVRRSLRAIEPLEVPFSLKSTREPHLVWHRLDFDIDDSSIAALLLTFARLGGKSSFGVGYVSAASVAAPDWRQVFVEPIGPLDARIELREPARDQIDQLVATIRSCDARDGHARDLLARDPELHGAAEPRSLPIRILRQSTLDASSSQHFATGASLTFTVATQGGAGIWYDDRRLTAADLECILTSFRVLQTDVTAHPETPVCELALLDGDALSRLQTFNADLDDGDPDDIANQCVHRLFEAQVGLTPARIACIFQGERASYGELNARANRLARHLQTLGVRPGDLIGVMVDRSIDMLVALFAVHKAGAAYVPLDPTYPPDRLAYMIEDSGARIVITRRASARGVGAATALVLDEIRESLPSYSDLDLDVPISNHELAYVIYTSGSTGKPKGVMVEHRQVVNFFIGMDKRIEPGPGIWLAVTSISFDISVLELFWTLARGFTIVLHADTNPRGSRGAERPRRIEFGLFYWNVADETSLDQRDKYRLLLESAKFADRHGFNAVWNPERHFEPFGGLFPNPAVTAAALAVITQNVSIRAGSCVVPLHSPIRIAEEWSVVDNLSNGRVGISIAAGWAPPDFAIRPESFADAKQVMFESAEIVRRLWRGERVEFPGPSGPIEVRTLPRPIQKELPIWVTTAGNLDTFVQAGRIGANLLTHLLGQTLEEVAEKTKAYRRAYREAGHPGRGTVTLMLHTFVGQDADSVESIVRGPLKAYLRSAMNLVKAAAWQFPTFKKMSDEQGKTLDQYFATISEPDLDDLLEFAFQRYFRTSGLFGTPQHCLELVMRTQAADIDEVANLIDFGIDTDIVLAHLEDLDRLKDMARAQTSIAPMANDGATDQFADHSLAKLFAEHRITHFQCTPSMATMLVDDGVARPSLRTLKHMMVGGEAFSPELAERLRRSVSGRVTNMYGPTETTIWSAVGDVDDSNPHVSHPQNVSIGRPLPNQRIYILDEHQRRLPAGIAGELVIGGAGIVRGYWRRPELTSERFLPDPFASMDGARMYRTGDLARYRDDGCIECLGRLDHQVKIRGYRVELGEIEALLRSHPQVLEGAVILREDEPGDQRLVGYVRSADDAGVDGADLKQWLRQLLPEFMVPSHFVRLTAMPLTPSGKIDRKNLPAPIAVDRGKSEITLPKNAAEELLSEIWRRALGVSQVGTRENFFDIGGHSLLVVQILKELRERTDRAVQLTDLFKHTTIETLARFISGEGEGPEAASRGKSRAEARRSARNRGRG